MVEMPNSTYTIKIGKTNFIVCVKQAEKATKSLDSVFMDMCRHEVQGDFVKEEEINFEKIRKTS